MDNKIMYIVKTLDKAKNNQTNSIIGVFRFENGKEEQVGEYERLSHTRETTFFAFQQNGKDFALYSPHYSEIRIMELPSCKDIGGEKSSPDDFCAIDFYVPSYIEQEITGKIISAGGKVEENSWTIRVSEPKEEHLTEYVRISTYENKNTGQTDSSETIYRPLTSRLYYPFGFVYGCRWMDDTTVHFLDLSEVEKGIIKREARFGYVEKPHGISLKEAIDMQYYNRYSGDAEKHFQIHIMQTFDLATGERMIESYNKLYAE